MTKDFVMDQLGNLLDLLGRIPEDTNIINIGIDDCAPYIQIYNGIRQVADGMKINTRDKPEYEFLELSVCLNGFKVLQLEGREKETDPSAANTESGGPNGQS